MKIKTSDLTGNALDWAVAVVEGLKPIYSSHWITPRSEDTERRVCIVNTKTRPAFAQLFEPSTDWWLGGPIIEQLVSRGLRLSGFRTRFVSDKPSCQAQLDDIVVGGPTPLIAAMRCYVASKLGDEVDIPDELLA